MENNINKTEIDWFRSELEMLKDKIVVWLKEENNFKQVKEKEILITEYSKKSYKCKKYTFETNNLGTFHLSPYGLSIIGAKCRAQIETENNSISLLYLWDSGSEIISKTTDGNKTIKKQFPYYKVITEGWYLFDLRTKNTMNFTKNNFYKLFK